MCIYIVSVKITVCSVKTTVFHNRVVMHHEKIIKFRLHEDVPLAWGRP